MKRTIVGAAVGTLLLGAGCSGEADGHAEPTGGTSTQTGPAVPSSATPESSTTPDLPHSGAPKVTDPLPKSVLSGDPCDAMTQEQVDAALGKAVAGERDDLRSGPGCRWARPERSTAVGIEFSLGSGQGLSAFYKNTKPQRETFQEVEPVAEFPAVVFQPSEGSDFCTTAVGLADEYAVTVTVTVGDEGSDPCQGAARVAGDVVANLKSKA